MDELPTVALLWLPDEADWGFAMRDPATGRWLLIECRPVRVIPEDHEPALRRAVFTDPIGPEP